MTGPRGRLPSQGRSPGHVGSPSATPLRRQGGYSCHHHFIDKGMAALKDA